MKRALLYIGRFIAVLLMPTAVLLLTVGITLDAFLPAIADPENIKNGLREQNLYRDAVPVVFPAVAESASHNVDEAFLDTILEIRDNLTEDYWRVVANELIPPEWVQAQVETAIDAVYAYLEGDEAFVEYQLDMATLEERLSGEPGERAIATIIAFARPCTDEEIRQVRTQGLQERQITDVPICSPSSAVGKNVLERHLTQTFEGIGTALSSEGELQGSLTLGFLNIRERLQPDGTARLQVIAESEEEGGSAVIFTRVFYQMHPHYRPAMYTLAGAVVGLIIMFAVRSFKGLFRWVGWTSILSSITLFVVALSLSIGLVRVPPPDPTQNTIFEELQIRIANGILSAAFADFMEPIIGQGVILLLFGLALLMVSFFVPGPRAVVHIRSGAAPIAGATNG